jgi:hypothetical protein
MPTIVSLEQQADDARSCEAWSADDSDQAMRDGWDIFSTARDASIEDEIVRGKAYGHRPFELQRVDEMQRFQNDDEAHSHVLNQAQLGNLLAIKALRFLRIHSPIERAAIEPQSSTQKGLTS